MKPTTIRLPADLLDELDAEADEHEFHTRTEYLRYIIDHRELVVSIALEQRKTRVDELADRIADVEERLEAVEATDAPEPAPAEDEGPAVEEIELDGADSAAAESGAEPADEPAAGADEPETLQSLPVLEEDEEEPEALELREPGPENVEQRARGLDFFAPTREIRREREAAVVAAWETLVEYGELTREDFADLVFESHAAAFSSFDGWYDRLLVPALEQFEDVERADEATWRYAGGE